ALAARLRTIPLSHARSFAGSRKSDSACHAEMKVSCARSSEREGAAGAVRERADQRLVALDDVAKRFAVTVARLLQELGIGQRLRVISVHAYKWPRAGKR